MAIVGGIDDENDPNKPGVATAGAGGGGFVNGSGGQGATTKAAPTSSGSYTNLTSYLGANQGSGGVTGQAAGNTVQQSGDVSNAANKALTTNAGKEVVRARVDPSKLAAIQASGATVDKNQLNQINAGIGTGKNATYSGPSMKGSVKDHVIAAPPTVKYGGPSDVTGVTGAGDAEGAMNTLGGDLGNITGGQGGRAALLQKSYQQPSYTKGENNLDSFLMGGTPGGQAAIAGAKTHWDGQGKSYQGVLDKINGNISTAQKSAVDTNKAYSDAVDNAKGQTKTVQSVYDKAEKAARDQAQANANAWRPPAPPAAAEAVPEAPPPEDTHIPYTAHARPNDFIGTSMDKMDASISKDGAEIAKANKEIPGAGGNVNVPNVVQQVKDTPKNVLNAVVPGSSKHLPHLGFAHGGQVPSYDELLKMLGAK